MVKMRSAVYFAAAVLAEVLSWLPLALGFVVGVCIWAFVTGYVRGRALFVEDA